MHKTTRLFNSGLAGASASDMDCMHEESFALTCVLRSQELIVGTMHHHDELIPRCYYVLNPGFAHLPRVAILPPCHPARSGLVGHPSESIKAAQHRLLACLSTSAHVAASKYRAPSTVSSTVRIHSPHGNLRCSLPHLADFAGLDQFLPISVPPHNRRNEEAHMTTIACTYPCM